MEEKKKYPHLFATLAAALSRALSTAAAAVRRRAALARAAAARAALAGGGVQPHPLSRCPPWCLRPASVLSTIPRSAP